MLISISDHRSRHNPSKLCFNAGLLRLLDIRDSRRQPWIAPN